MEVKKVVPHLLFSVITLSCSFSTIANNTIPLTGSFRVNESGAATYSLPLDLPKARADVVPSVAINYSSSGSEGPLGVGFSLQANSAITRCAQTIAQDNQNIGVDLSNTDRFCLDGQRLIAVSGSYGADGTEYRKEIDDQSIIYSYGQAAGGGPLAFKVEKKNGDTLYFGQIASALGENFYDTDNHGDNDDAGRIVTNKNGNEVLLYWSEKALVDPFGNYISYSYSSGSSKEHYLKTISYGGNINTGDIPYTDLQLSYIDNRRPKSGKVYGNDYFQTKLLNAITISIDGQLQSRYVLTYNSDDEEQTPNHLEQIKKCVNSANSNCSHPIEFNWTTVDKGSQYPLFSKTATFSSIPVSNPNYQQFFDMSGDGKADTIYTKSDRWRVYDADSKTSYSLSSIGGSHPEYALPINFNGDGQGDLLVANNENSNWYVLTMLPSTSTREVCEPDGQGGRLCEQTQWHSNTSQINTGIVATGLKGKTIVADVDGDGLEDIVTIDGKSIKWNKNTGTKFNTAQSLYTFTNSGPESFSKVITQTRYSKNNTSAIDINGDGKTDLIVKLAITKGSCIVQGKEVRVNNRQECRNDVRGTWQTRTTNDWHVFISQGDRYVETTDNLFRSKVDTVQAADFNGDGLTDLAFLIDNQWDIAFSDGVGFDTGVSTGISMSNEAYQNRTYFVDLDGDGKADILAPISSSQYRVYLTRSTKGSSALSWNNFGTLPLRYTDPVRFSDTQGNGHMDILYAHDGKWLALKNALPADDNTINTITDGLGVSTKISYERLTDSDIYVTQDSSAANEEGNYSFVAPMLVTKKVTTETGTSSSQSISYRYGGLAVNRLGRGFLGFELLRTIDEQTHIQTDTLYHQSFPYTGLPRATLQSYQGQELNHSTNTYSVSHPNASNRIYQVNQTRTIDETRQLGEDKLTVYPLAKTVTDTEYDGWANALRIEVNNYELDSGTLVAKTVTENTYNGAGGGASKGRLSNTDVSKARYNQLQSVDTIKRSSSFTYNSSTGVLVSETVAPYNDTFKKTTRYQYDVYGNTIQTAVSALTSSGQSQTRTTSQTFDSRGRYLASSTNELGESTSYRYNNTAPGAVTGVITRVSQTDANGLTSSKQYDRWGRVIKETDPAGLAQTTSYHVCTNCGNFPNAYLYTEITPQGGQQKYSFTDKYGNNVGNRVQGFAAGSWIATHKTYDSKGRVKKQYLPAMMAQGRSPYYTEYTYDIYDRVIKTTQHTAEKNVVTQHWYQGLIEVRVDEQDRQITEQHAVTGEVQKITDQAYNTIDYVYDAYGNLLSAWLDDGSLARTRTQYDRFGRKTATIDLDKGTTRYQYNAFGELVSQTNAAGQVTHFLYDKAGRLVSRQEAEQRTCWVYGTAANNNAGRLMAERVQPAANACSSSQGMLQRKQTTYDSVGRVAQQITKIGGSTFTVKYTYDANGRPATVTYPNNKVAVRNRYNSNGYLYQRENANTGDVYQTINSMDAQGNITDSSYGNGASELRSYAKDTGLVTDIVVSNGGTSLQDIHYQYNSTDHNITQRNVTLKAANADFSERYTYDDGDPSYGYDRLTKREITVSSGAVNLPSSFKSTQRYQYDKYGNFTFKTGSGYYQYSGDNPYRLLHVCDTQGCESTTTAASIRCPSGYTLNNAKTSCTKTTTSPAQSQINYSCPSGYSLSGSQCRRTQTTSASSHQETTCPSGYNLLSDGRCRSKRSTYISSRSQPSGYYCPNWEPNGGGTRMWECYSYHSAQTTTVYSCSSGWSLSGSQCRRTQTQSANAKTVFSCKKGKLSGKSCVQTQTTAPTVSCPSGYTNNKGVCSRVSTSRYALQYDAKGNVTSDGNRHFTYTSFDKVSQLRIGSSTQTSFAYDGEHSRYKRVDIRQLDGQSRTTTTLYVGGLYEHITHSGSHAVTEEKFYIGNIVVTKRSNNANNIYYLFGDGQGSTMTITNNQGNIVQQFIYDPWGKQDHVYSESNLLNIYVSPANSKGYTGHEQIADFDIIHMNGRIYDPTLGRFLQADPHIQSPSNTQNYNRYSYVLNNPMNYTDPSGYFFSGVKKFIKKHWRMLASVAAAYFTYGMYTGVWGFTQAEFMDSVVGGALAGAVSGAISTGSLKGALYGGASGAVFGAIGAADITVNQRLAEASVAGGIMSVVQGGHFGNGFVSAGVTAILGSNNNLEGPTNQVISSAVIGGTVSEITGGKFSNGAYSAAFATALRADWGDKPNALEENSSDTNKKNPEGNRKALTKALDKLEKEGVIDSRHSFNSSSDAAKEILNAVTKLSHKYGLEVGGNIKLENGKYHYTLPEVGESGRIVSLSTNTPTYHTHPHNHNLLFSNTFTNGEGKGDALWVETYKQSAYLGVEINGRVGIAVCEYLHCFNFGINGSEGRVIQ